MSFPGERGDVNLPGEGPHDVGIDGKVNRRRAPTAWPLVGTDGSEAPHEVGIDRKANGAMPPMPWRWASAGRSEAAL